MSNNSGSGMLSEILIELKKSGILSSLTRGENLGLFEIFTRIGDEYGCDDKSRILSEFIDDYSLCGVCLEPAYLEHGLCKECHDEGCGQKGCPKNI